MKWNDIMSYLLLYGWMQIDESNVCCMVYALLFVIVSLSLSLS